jgi:hypothetical protein
VLTAPAVVGGVREKEELGRRHGAFAVDMESAVVARLCQRRGVPFGCVRAISDDAGTLLSPRLTALLTCGRGSLFRVLAAVAVQPSLAVELQRLAAATRLAAEQLALALGELLTLTLSWGREL